MIPQIYPHTANPNVLGDFDIVPFIEAMDRMDRAPRIVSDDNDSDTTDKPAPAPAPVKKPMRITDPMPKQLQ